MDKKRGDDAQDHAKDHADRKIGSPEPSESEGERTKEDGAVRVEDLNSEIDEGAN